MIDFLHNFNPQPILFDFGLFKIYWYGFFVMLGVLLAFFVVLKLSKKYNLKKEVMIDLAFWIIIFGIIGARLYDVLLEWKYYIVYPFDIFKIWNGGLAIHGGVIAGLIVLYFFSKKRKINFWLLSSITMTGLVTAQAVGRWGNYFNQELFGKPSNLSWAIPIDIINRPESYFVEKFFHPTFLYESIGCLAIFIILLLMHYLFLSKKENIEKSKNLNNKYIIITLAYLVLYSVLRFFLEFVRIDNTLNVFSLRLPQVVSILIVLICIIFFFKKRNKVVI